MLKELSNSVAELQKCQIRIGLVLVARPLVKELFKRQNEDMNIIYCRLVLCHTVGTRLPETVIMK